MGKRTLVPLGPYHPLLEEPEFFKLYCDGEIVKEMVMGNTIVSSYSWGVSENMGNEHKKAERKHFASNRFQHRTSWWHSNSDYRRTHRDQFDNIIHILQIGINYVQIKCIFLLFV